MRLLIDLAFAAVFVVVGFHLFTQYRKANGSTWQRLLSAAKESATILWGKFCLLLAALVSQLDNLADIAGMPEAKTFIETWLGNPKAVAGIMLALSLVTIAARKRTL
jgi:hypothetical protein